MCKTSWCVTHISVRKLDTLNAVRAVGPGTAEDENFEKSSLKTKKIDHVVKT